MGLIFTITPTIDAQAAIYNQANKYPNCLDVHTDFRFHVESNRPSFYISASYVDELIPLNIHGYADSYDKAFAEFQAKLEAYFKPVETYLN